MTAFAYTQDHVALSTSRERIAPMYSLFDIFYNGGFARGLIMAWIACAAVAYLIAVYSLFGLSVTLTQRIGSVKALGESNTIMELNLQRTYTEFARTNQDTLQSMEKISTIRYVLPADTAVSRADYR